MRSERLKNIPPYLFAELDKLKAKARAEGKDLIDLSVGDPDLRPPKALIEKLKEAIDHPQSHNYPEYAGSEHFRAHLSSWLKDRHNVNVDHKSEVISLIGSKEGIAHLTLGILNPGDVAILTSPYFPPYIDALTLSGAVPYLLPLREENDFLPEFDEIPKDILNKTKMILLNYPHNPTGAVATIETFQRAVEIAKKHKIVVCHDGAYLDIFQKKKPISFMSVDGAKDVGIELYSFSKTFNIPGWRIGFASGNEQIISALGRVKMIVDSGQFKAIQDALIYAMINLKEFTTQNNSIYKERALILASGLKKIGLKTRDLEATFYLWAKIPDNLGSTDFCKKLLDKCHLAATPGAGFGSAGEGYIRFSLTQPTSVIEKAAKRMVTCVPLFT